MIRDICAGLKDIFSAGVLVCSSGGGKSQIVVNDVAVERVRSFGDVLSLPAAPTYPLRLWRRIAEHDLLALHAPFPLADLVFAFGLGRNRPLVVHWHADIVSHAALRPVRGAVDAADAAAGGRDHRVRRRPGRQHALAAGVRRQMPHHSIRRGCREISTADVTARRRQQSRPARARLRPARPLQGL